MAIFGVKSHFAQRKFVTKFLCENYHQQSCKAFIGLIYLCKSDWWGRPRPFLPEIMDQTHHVGAKSWIFDLFWLVSPQL